MAVINTGFDPLFGDPLRRLLAEARARGMNPNIISGVRDDETQRQLVANAVATKAGQPLPYPDRGPVQKAAAVGYSPHEYGTGGDISGIPQDQLSKLAPQFGLNTVAGDPGHIELANWQQTAANQPPPTPWSNIGNFPSQVAQNVDMSVPSAGGFNIPGKTINSSPINIVAQELISRGVKPEVAAGAVASLMGESGRNLDPTSFNSKDPGGGSGGIGQWNRDRLVGDHGLLSFAAANGVTGLDINNPRDAIKVPFDVQAHYLGHELDTTHSSVLKGLQVANTGEEGLTTWTNNFEVPADKPAAIAQRMGNIQPVMNSINNPGTNINSTVASASDPSVASLIGKGDWGGAAKAFAGNPDLMKSLQGLGGGQSGGQGKTQTPNLLPPPPNLQTNQQAISQQAPQLMAQLIAQQQQPPLLQRRPPGLSLGGYFG